MSPTEQWFPTHPEKTRKNYCTSLHKHTPMPKLNVYWFFRPGHTVVVHLCLLRVDRCFLALLVCHTAIFRLPLRCCSKATCVTKCLIHIWSWSCRYYLKNIANLTSKSSSVLKWISISSEQKSLFFWRTQAHNVRQCSLYRYAVIIHLLIWVFPFTSHTESHRQKIILCLLFSVKCCCHGSTESIGKMKSCIYMSTVIP